MDELVRVPQGNPAPLAKTFYNGSTVVDPGTVAVAVAADDGTALAGGTATGSGAAARSFTLTTAHTVNLDSLLVTWTSPTYGPRTTIVEVVGGFLFNTRDITGYPDERIQRQRIEVEQYIEHELGFATVPRYSRVTIDGAGSGPLRVSKPYVQRVRWATVNGVALSAADLTALSYDRVGNVYGYGWPTGVGNIVAGVEHGLRTPEYPLRTAALQLAQYGLDVATNGSVDPRAERVITVDGTMVFGAGPTGLPSVDRVIMSYGFPRVA